MLSLTSKLVNPNPFLDLQVNSQQNLAQCSFPQTPLAEFGLGIRFQIVVYSVVDFSSAVALQQQW